MVGCWPLATFTLHPNSIVSKVVGILSLDEWKISEALAGSPYAPHDLAKIVASHGRMKVLPHESPKEGVTQPQLAICIP